ncbi:phage holin family protein [Ammoniphilus resinae]|uniref:Membrane protein n=1 Tax=Ammoniphilus resinae TaxID=861532 RepID=A0ABS4GL69_9BACL|nr:phage holin family protein [Ammoniphilus resinae]MBP1930996.1 putative membrane protein [Ammoniphilus resinae]
MRFLLRILFSGLSLWIADLLIDSISLRGFGTAVLAAIILGLVNFFIKPILIFFTFPITVLSLGLFLLVINAITYWIASLFVPGFEIYSFWGAFLGAIVTSVVNALLNSLIKDRD